MREIVIDTDGGGAARRAIGEHSPIDPDARVTRKNGGSHPAHRTPTIDNGPTGAFPKTDYKYQSR
jgi:hypothetical protein